MSSDTLCGSVSSYIVILAKEKDIRASSTIKVSSTSAKVAPRADETAASEVVDDFFVKRLFLLWVCRGLSVSVSVVHFDNCGIGAMVKRACQV